MAKKKLLPDRRVTFTLPTELLDACEAKLAERGSDLKTFIRLQLTAFSHQTGAITLESKMPFGKYLGVLVEDIVRGDPKYLCWILSSSTSTNKFGIDVLELLEELEEK
jgi:uncharacterized protein (DUF3820 family)